MNVLNLLLLPDWAIFSRCSMRAIAVGTYQGSITLLFMFIFPTPLALCYCFTMLACVAKLVAIKIPQWVWDKQVHLHLQVSNLDNLWHVESVKRQKQGVGGDNLAFFLHSYTVNLKTP